MINLSISEQKALIKALSYWINHWDFECPTLFGLEKADFIEISNNFPSMLKNKRDITLTAGLGSLREMLYGASYLHESKFIETIGIDFEKASDLCDKILNSLQVIDKL